MPYRISLIAATLLIVLASFSFAVEKAQTKCPVTGELINTASSPHIDYDGQRIYFCCDACVPTFKADPEKYFGAIAAEGVVLENMQTVCPVTEEKIENKEAFTDYKGRRIYFCCNGCKEKFAKDPVIFLKKMSEK